MKKILFGVTSLSMVLAIGSVWGKEIKGKTKRMPVTDGIIQIDKWTQAPIYPGVQSATVTVAELPKPVGRKIITYAIKHPTKGDHTLDVSKFYTGKSIFKVTVGNFVQGDGETVFKNCTANVEDGVHISITNKGTRVQISNLCE